MGWASKADTNPDDFFMNGHHFVMIPDGTYDEYPDAVVRMFNPTLPEGINPDIDDATIENFRILPNNKIEVEYYISIYNEWKKTFLVVGEIKIIDDEIVFKAESISEKVENNE
jgi:hypothetical protein